MTADESSILAPNMDEYIQRFQLNIQQDIAGAFATATIAVAAVAALESYHRTVDNSD